MTSRRIRNRLLAEQSGMTLIELVIGLSIGLIVIMATFAVLDRATTLQAEVADRQDAVQRGRQAMELITRQLRSQVCLGTSAEPISYGDGNTIIFYADLSDGSQNVAQRTLTYVPASGETPGVLREDVRDGVGVYPELTFSEDPDSSRVLLGNVEQAQSGGVDQPVFRYYAFQPGSPTGDMDLLTTPLTAEDASRTVMVRIAYTAMPDRPVPKRKDSTTLVDDVYVRLADPTRPLEGPRCL
jgi:prepilin-type N-terminal cleavage/methylation domain-containing protein